MLPVFLFTVIQFISAENSCTSLDHVQVIRGKLFPNHVFLEITTEGVMSCSRACMMRKMCKSFNYNDNTGNCQLNNRTLTSPQRLIDENNYVSSDISNWPIRLAGLCANHSCPVNSYCGPVDDLLYSCVITGCLGLPSLDHGRFDSSPDYSPIGTIISPSCDADYVPGGDTFCQENGTWSRARCVNMTSCSDVKRLLPHSGDGEYWLILPNISNYRARIYCHGMAEVNQSEYLSLKYINHGIYPQESNLGCSETSSSIDCKGSGGEIWFSKIRVNIETMRVQLQDLTFTNISNMPNDLQYGTAHDCYTYHDDGKLRCGVKGEFTIDLRGTGWRISNEQEWITYGYLPYMMPVERKRNGTVIYLNCGGYGGGCKPEDGLFLTPYPDDIDTE